MPFLEMILPIVGFKLIDCAHHGRDICIARRIGIDGVGQVECYEPIARSSIIHGYPQAGIERCHGRLTQRKKKTFR